MAFLNVEFPVSNLRLVHGLRKSIASPTTIVGNGNIEYRIKKLQNYRTQWQYPARLLSSTDRKAIALFFAEVAQFGLYSFKYKDPDLNQWNLTPLTYTGSGNNFYLTTQGTDTHPVFHLGGDIVVRNGASVVSYTKVIQDGVSFINVPGATGGINISGTFFHAARFNQAELGWTMDALNTNNSSFGDNLSDISLIEVFEY